MGRITAARLIEVARGELGYHEKYSNYALENKTANSGSGNWTKYARDLAAAGYYNGGKNGFAWCDVFVDWCFYELAGRDSAKAQAVECQTGPLGAGCAFSRQYYRDQGRLFTRPQPGDQVFFQQGGVITHTGIVETVDGNSFSTIEGNKSDQVARGKYALGDPYVCDFGRPWYEEEEDEDEPVLTAPATTPAVSSKVLTVPAKGVDVSTWQGSINWEKAAASGIKFAMIRAGYGQNNIDQQFRANAMGAVKAGVYVGFYWFSYAYTNEMAWAEANYLVEAVKSLGLPVMFPLAFDYEYDSDVKAKAAGYSPDIVKQADTFLARIEERGGYAMNYTNVDYLNRGFSRLTQFDLWLAHWGRSEPSRKCGIWQYGSDGSVPGMSGRIDMDLAYIDYPAVMKDKGLNILTDEEREAIVVPVVKHPYGYASRTTGYVRYGKTHDGVKAVQYALDALGYDIGSDGIDGMYGVNTRAAVIRFQANHGISADGIVGDETRGVFAELGY